MVCVTRARRDITDIGCRGGEEFCFTIEENDMMMAMLRYVAHAPAVRARARQPRARAPRARVSARARTQAGAARCAARAYKKVQQCSAKVKRASAVVRSIPDERPATR